MQKKKGQVWISDYTISLVLFLSAVLIAINILLNSFSSNAEFSLIKSDSTRISQSLVSEGIPSDWKNESVLRIGLLSGNRIDPAKTYSFMNMTNYSYAAVQAKLQTKYDFLVLLEDNSRIISFDGYCSGGYPDISRAQMPTLPGEDCKAPDFSTINYKDMIRITRFVVHDARIMRMQIYVWK